MNVVLNGFDTAADINKARDDLAKIYEVSVTYSAANLSKPEQIVQMAEDASRIFGQVDLLVNNAGILHAGPVEVTPPNTWDSIMAINLSAVFHAIRTVLPGIKAQGFGRIVNVSLALGLVGAANYAAYAASKHAVAGLTKAAALETAQNTINAGCPGYVRTLLVEHEIEEVAKARSVSAEEAYATFSAKSNRQGGL
jgi:3-hydroxybutyrate dehydrogenase